MSKNRTTRTRQAALLAGALGLAVAVPTLTFAQPAPKKKPDDTWISVSGTIVSTTPHSFRLDYGKGVITVEMDDFDFYAEGRALMENDQVVVYGLIDDDAFKKRTIEASSVYVENLRTHFFASAEDEEDFATVTGVEMDPAIEVIGRVGQVQGRELQLHTGTATLDVDTASMGYDPLDQEGFQQLRTGDRVRVRGDLDVGLFDDLDLVAESIVTLASSDARGDASGTEAGSAVTSRRDRRADDSGRHAAMR